MITTLGFPLGGGLAHHCQGQSPITMLVGLFSLHFLRPKHSVHRLLFRRNFCGEKKHFLSSVQLSQRVFMPMQKSWTSRNSTFCSRFSCFSMVFSFFLCWKSRPFRHAAQSCPLVFCNTLSQSENSPGCVWESGRFGRSKTCFSLDSLEGLG